MEQINKEQFAKEYLNSKFTYDIDSLIAIGNKSAIGSLDTYLAGYDKAKEFYSKQLKIKDDLCQRLQERRSEMQGEAERLKQELQEARELLLKAISNPLTDIEISEIQSFLNK